ncbi:hypothetical protein O3P69_019018 [Scylla paramamosain]|uniref:Uncharacterized protein n=1 Tax=Scylla paramamosain TaxID=85552 RepID=A0AAW0T8V8_SCYPA
MLFFHASLSSVPVFRQEMRRRWRGLSVQPQASPVGGFDGYFLSLTAEKNKRNPWFVGLLPGQDYPRGKYGLTEKLGGGKISEGSL